MKVLLFLNGFEGCQTGIEDGFLHLVKQGKVSELKWFYYLEYAKQHSGDIARHQMMMIAEEFLPDIIVFFHVANLKVDVKFINGFKNITSKPLLVYDEGDMYGTWAKPLTKSIEAILSTVDVVSIRGLGKFHSTVRKYANNVIYTPHHNDIARHIQNPFVFPERGEEIILIGNRIKPKFMSFIRRLPGAKGRESFVRTMGRNFPKDFRLYGNGWKGFKCDKGPIDFYSQNEYYRTARITVAYEHYPDIPFYFSNRLPMALMNGSLYVCHYHQGYETMFPQGEFIFFFKTHDEARDIISYLLSLNQEELLTRSKKAREFALRLYHPEVVWSNFYTNVLKHDKS